MDHVVHQNDSQLVEFCGPPPCLPSCTIKQTRVLHRSRSGRSRFSRFSWIHTGMRQTRPGASRRGDADGGAGDRHPRHLSPIPSPVDASGLLRRCGARGFGQCAMSLLAQAICALERSTCSARTRSDPRCEAEQASTFDNAVTHTYSFLRIPPPVEKKKSLVFSQGELLLGRDATTFNDA